METVTSISSQTCLAKSPNKHNKLFVVAEPMNEDFVKEIENGAIKSYDDPKVTARKLIDKYKWDQFEARKLWTFGPEGLGSNLLIDQTQAVQYLQEIRNSMKTAFQWVTKEGIVAEENMRGIKFNIINGELHSEVIHRAGGQILPTARRVYYAAEMTASPRFQEPVYLVQISTPNDVMNGVYQCLSQRRGVVFSEELVTGTPLLNIKAYLPVSESFGLNEQLRSLTSGKAFPQCIFDHWEVIPQDPFDINSTAYTITMNIRKRKGLKQELPVLRDFNDKQ